MKKTYGWLSAFALILLLVLAGCSDSGKEGSAEGSGGDGKKAVKEGNDLVIAVADNFTTLDPHDTNDTLSNSAEKTMMEGLLGFDENMNVIPLLAEEYDANDEATEFTFKLRENVKFHDGTPFNAEAVKVNFDRLADPDSGLKRHSLFALIQSTEVISDYEVKFTLSEPFGAMINTFAHPAALIHSPKALEEYGKDVGKHPVGTGPFKFVEWKPSEGLKIEKNTDYWNEGYPKVDAITFKPVSENGSRIAMLQTGEADFIYPVPTEQVEGVNGKNGIEVESKPSIVVRYMAMNTMKEPYNDIKVRQALNYAIDKDAFIKVVMNGQGEKLDSVIAPDVQFYSKQELYDFNLEKAKELLKEAGVKEGMKAKLWGGNSSSTVKAMEFLQQQLAAVGFDVEVVPMESGTLSDKIWSVQNADDAELELYYGGWSPSTGDADWGIRPLVGGEDAFPPKSYNVSYYDNDEVNKLISAGLQTANEDDRAKAYEDVQKLIWDDAPWVFLSADNTLAGKKNYLKGVYLLPDGSLSVSEAEIE
ncbi:MULTISPECIES: glutathione ABC transporter substrate-binding protein [Sporosarcina]|uniref:glutathione ABC transporter substrate-binding protein n=1 Tax=Sporosarcina TaxID=1569 RepID=UPI00058C3006|nr:MULTISPECIES: glutathione ABC transporter substrate-binding protein [Sporosarcina]WJY26196.1 glutathione ABC transporter substrate-binding protein [Sporosarcina sp. 0.2-SM1T-5]